MTDAAEDWIRSWSDSVSERAAAARELADRVARLTVEATDPDRTVTTTVNGSGGLVDLRLEPGAGRIPMDDLADRILRTMRRAQGRLAERVAEEAAQTVGEDSESARAVVNSFAQRYPTTEDDDATGNGAPEDGGAWRDNGAWRDGGRGDNGRRADDGAWRNGGGRGDGGPWRDDGRGDGGPWRDGGRGYGR
jgi:phenylpyruvate tautomerase PptA (4-oxalocrotonate tautomerase family)